MTDFGKRLQNLEAKGLFGRSRGFRPSGASCSPTARYYMATRRHCMRFQSAARPLFPPAASNDRPLLLRDFGLIPDQGPSVPKNTGPLSGVLDSVLYASSVAHGGGFLFPSARPRMLYGCSLVEPSALSAAGRREIIFQR